MNIEDRSIADIPVLSPISIADALIKHKRDIKYVHLADSNRRAPGWGHLNFTEVFSALRKIEYKGWGSVEIPPVPSPDEAAKQAADFLLPYLANAK